MFSETIPLDLQTSFSSKSTGGLSLSLKLKKGAPVMNTTNIELKYRMINGQFGTVYDPGLIDSSITKAYLKLDDENTDKKTMLKD